MGAGFIAGVVVVGSKGGNVHLAVLGNVPELGSLVVHGCFLIVAMVFGVFRR